MIRFENIQKSFGKLEVLKGIDLEISQAGLIAILGPNGSGKTTLIKSLLGMVLHSGGDILVNGKPIQGEFDYRRELLYLPQIANFPENMKVKELIALLQDLRGTRQTRERELIKLFHLESHLNKKVSTLSGGTLQKVNLTLCLMFEAPLIILDEPSNGLDPVSLYNLKSFLKKEVEKGKFIIMTTHIMSLVEELSQRTIFMLEGDIIFDGTNSQLKENYGGGSLEDSIAQMVGEIQNA